jgi:hypothetical protein
MIILVHASIDRDCRVLTDLKISKLSDKMCAWGVGSFSLQCTSCFDLPEGIFEPIK